jgi:mannopine transport system permease protein
MTSGYDRRTSLLLLAPMALLFLGLFVVPVGALLGGSVVVDGHITLNHYERVFSESVYVTVLLRTLRIAAFVTVLALLLGYPIAYAMSKLSGWRATLLLACVLIPLWTSVLVRSYAWVTLFQRNGIINETLQGLGLIGQPLELLYTEGAVLIAMTHVLLPFMVLPIFSTLRGVDPALVPAARSLGAGAFSAFRHVVLPLSVPGVAAGCVIVFVLSLGFFITPALVGGPRTQLISTLIGQQVTTLLNFGFAGALAAVLVGVTLVLVLIFNRVLRVNRGAL